MNQAELKGDLKHIEDDVNRADMPEGAKRVFRDLLEWQRSFVDQSVVAVKRIDVVEDAVDELLHGAEEAITMESGKVIATALEQGRLVCVAISAALEKSPFDELTTKRFGDLIKNCERSTAIALQLVEELVMPDEGDEPEDDPDEVSTVKPGAPPTEPADDDDEPEIDDEESDDDLEDDEEADNG